MLIHIFLTFFSFFFFPAFTIVEKDASEEPNGRKRRKRRHFQMDNIYSQYDPLSKDESKKNKRKLNSFDYDDYEDDDEDDRSSNGTDNKEKDPYATPKPDESMPPSNQLLSGMPSVAASVTNSNSGSRAPSEGASDSQFDDEQRMLDEELLQLTTKKRGRPPGRKSKPTTAASSIANSPEQVAPRKPGRPRKKHMIEDLIKAETELRGQNGARVHTGLATINSSYSQPVALAPSAGSNRIASTGTSISPTSSIASGASVASCITSPSSPSTLPPTSHPVQAISGNTHDSIPKHNTAFSLAEFKDIDINGLDMESIENEIAAITKQHYQHVDHYPELQHILSSEFDIDQNLPVPPSLSNKFKLPKLNNDSIPTTNDTSNPIKINDITGNNISKELNAISESAGNLAELTESLQLVNGLNQAMVQQLRAWQSVAHSFEQSDATIDQATNTGTKTTNTENNDANPPMLLNFLSQKLKFDFLTTRSLVHATSHLLFPTENNGADHSLSNCDLHSRATLLYSYTQLLQSRDTTNYLRTLYTSRLSETARLRYLESRNRVLEARLKAQEASQKAVDTQMKREEARMRAEEAKMRAVEAKMKAREWKCRTKVEVRNEKERMKIADDHDDCDHNTDHCHVESGCERIEVDPKALADSKPDSNGIKAEDSESFNRTADPVASPESERLSNNEHVIV